MDPYVRRSLQLLRAGRAVIIFDLETTGLIRPGSPRPRAWELGAILRIRAEDGLDRREAHMIIDVGPLPASLIEWNRSQGIELDSGITTREGVAPAVALGKITRAMAGAVLVGHNISRYDSHVLIGDLEAEGLPVPLCLSDPDHQVDTLILARRLFPRGGLPSPRDHKLTTLARFAGYDSSATSFHRAQDDTRATEAVLEFLYAEAARRERMGLA